MAQGVCYLIPEKGHLPFEHGQKWKAGRLFENHRIVVMATGCSNSPPLPAVRRFNGIRWGRGSVYALKMALSSPSKLPLVSNTRRPALPVNASVSTGGDANVHARYSLPQLNGKRLLKMDEYFV
jgi:hypothetical protein